MAIVAKFWSACMHASPLDYLDAPILLSAHAPSTYAHLAHPQHDMTRVGIQCKPHHHGIISVCDPFVPCMNDVA